MNVNVDDSEIRKFEALASRWWDPEGEFKPLHRLNPVRMDFILQRSGHLAGKKVLDIGCGGGILTEALARQGAEVTGIDMGAAPLEVARLHQHESGLSIDYQRVTAEEFAESRAGEFDLVTCLEMLEHVPDPGSVIKACKRLTRTGGDLFFSTINRNPKAYLTAIIGAEYVLRMLPRGTHDYRKFIRPSELDHWCRQSGLSPQALTGMHFNPLTGQFSLGPNVDVNYLAHYRHNPVAEV